MTAPGNFTNVTISFDDYLDKQATWWVLVYDILIPIICAVGIFGNFMAVALIESSEQLKKLQSNIFLSVLTLFSNVFLLTLFLTWAEPLIDKLSVYNSQNSFGCKAITYLAHCADFACVWLIVLVSMDRAMVLQWAEKRTWIYSKISARKMTLILTVVAVLINWWLLVVASPVEHSGEWYCNVPEHHLELYFTLTTMETIISIIFPSILIILANATTAYKLKKYTENNILFTPSVRFRHSQTNADTKETFLGTQESPHDLQTGPTPSHSMGNLIGPNPGNEEDQSKGLITIDQGEEPPVVESMGIIEKDLQRRIVRSSDLHLLKTMLILTTVFLVLNLPSYLCRLFLSDIALDSTLVRFFWHLAYILYYCHHAVMFYLYVFNSRRMRKELKPAAVKLLECYCLKTVPDFGHETTA